MRSKVACAALFLSALAASAVSAAAPDPLELLKSVAAGPTTSYEGHVTVIRWFGKRTRAEEANVYFSPPNLYRWEFIAPDGSPERLVVSDGKKEYLSLARQKKVLSGDAVKSSPKPTEPDREVELMLKNYRLTLSGTEKRAGRAVWVVEISPRVHGKPTQRIWIDQETNVLLESRRFWEKGVFAVLSRYTRFEPKESLPDELFELKTEPGVQVDEHGLDPDYLSFEEMRRATGKTFNFPQALPGGFVFESADFFDVQAQAVRQARYTDGLASLSLFQTNRPVSLPKDASPEAALPPHPGDFGLASTGHVLRFKRGRLHYTLLGDVSEELLSVIAASVK